MQKWCCSAKAEQKVKRWSESFLTSRTSFLHFPPFQSLTQKIFIFSTWNLVKTVLSPFSQCLKITEKVSFNIGSLASYVYILSGKSSLKMPKKGDFLKAWNLRSSSVTRQVNFNRQKKWWKITIFNCENSSILPFLTILKCKCSSLRSQCWMRLFSRFSDTLQGASKISVQFLQITRP